MKKLLALLLILVTGISMCACNEYEGLDPNDYTYYNYNTTTTKNTDSETEPDTDQEDTSTLEAK